MLFSFSFYYLLRNSVNENIKTKLQHQAGEIEERLRIKDFPKDINFALFDSAGVLSYKTTSFDFKNITPYLHKKETFFILQNQQISERISALYIYKHPEHVIAVYKKDIDNQVEDVVATLLILNPVLLLTLIFLTSKILDKIMVPIKNVIGASKSISVDDFTRTIEPPKENDEIKELVDSFNEMRTRLEEGVESIERFNSDVSHELKTPLTVILGEIEITLRRPRTDAEYEQALNTVYEETKQMQKIVENMLLLTKYTKANIEASFEECGLDGLLLETIQKFHSKADAKEIIIELERVENISLQANRTLLALVFSNLIDNAIKYTTEGKNIYISLYEDKGIHFLVRDEGVGIAKEHLEKISERFYRVDESRNKKIEGFGLGLFIVKHVLELHNGMMHIDSELGNGTQIEVVL